MVHPGFWCLMDGICLHVYLLQHAITNISKEILNNMFDMKR